MKITRLISLLILLALFAGCRTKSDCIELSESIEFQFNSGNFIDTELLTDSLKNNCPEETLLIRRADSLIDISNRIMLDFPFTREEITGRVRSLGYDPSENNLAEWEKKNWLECRLINGEKRYFNRSATNLRLLRRFNETRKVRDSLVSIDPDMLLRRSHTEDIVRESEMVNRPVVPVDMLISFTMTVLADAVPDGDTIRCWLPYPKENYDRQTLVKFISASEKNYIIAPDSSVHRSVYMETIAHKGTPVLFNISYSYRSHGQHFNLSELPIKPYNRDSKLFRKYTREQLPQICFSDEVKSLADSITSPGDGPVTTVSKLYLWIKENIPWAGALEYSTMPDIPGYVIRNRRGDCGMQTFLFMSMARYKGIPVRWQSGWMVPPGSENLHDWCEVYYEGIGWVPADVSYDLQHSDNDLIKKFYLSGIDAYRLIVNEGVAGKFFPAKKYLRSDPFDFQRGEVEWRGGNLYYDKWDYEMEIKYLN